MQGRGEAAPSDRQNRDETGKNREEKGNIGKISPADGIRLATYAPGHYPSPQIQWSTLLSIVRNIALVTFLSEMLKLCLLSPKLIYRCVSHSETSMFKLGSGHVNAGRKRRDGFVDNRPNIRRQVSHQSI